MSRTNWLIVGSMLFVAVGGLLGFIRVMGADFIPEWLPNALTFVSGAIAVVLIVTVGDD